VWNWALDEQAAAEEDSAAQAASEWQGVLLWHPRGVGWLTALPAQAAPEWHACPV